MKSISLTPTQKISASIGLIGLAFVIMTAAIYIFLPVHANANPPISWGFAVDWKGLFRPDTMKLFSGISPYGSGLSGLLPPWTYVLLYPIALLPPDLGAAVMFTLTYFVYILVFYRSGAKLWMCLALLGSRFILLNAQNGNIDWLAVLGFIMPPQIGLFFVLIKPQIGIGLAIFWLVEAWRKGKTREVVRVFLPVTLAYLLSFVLFGLWPLRLVRELADPYNASFFPWSLLFGIPLLIYALYKRQKFTAVAATPLLSPYVNMHSYAVQLFAFIPSEVGFLLMIATSWLITN